MNFLLSLKNTTAKEKTAWVFLLKLLILECALKCIFFVYNYNISNGWSLKDFTEVWLILKWSLYYDVICIALINLPLLLIFLFAGKYLRYTLLKLSAAIFFALLNSFSIFLNTIDIFYYRFHLQRSDADLLYVLRNPFANANANVFFIYVAAAIFFCFIAWLIYKNILKMMIFNSGVNRFVLTNLLLIAFTVLSFVSGTKKLLPTYALTQLKSVQLPLVQNSFHSFVYSMYRRNELTIPGINYMSLTDQKSLFSNHKKNNLAKDSKNIVLFIMESVPLDFFDSSSPYKVTMPFLDSLVNKSTFFSNAFSYSYSSNKGITAILSGLPTITDVPLYHSPYTSISRTSIGNVLAKNKYSSAFFIGDNYDDFGFAKCTKWLGFQHYYSMEDIPGYSKMEKHSMGLHDEYVLHFMQDKINTMQPPFFAVQYNISTHYPYDIPKTFKDKYPSVSASPQMKTMQYYNNCLEQFFIYAATREWYKNTVFIFCSDHWARPVSSDVKIDEVESFRIPLFIYEPANEKKVLVSTPVSQLDVVNTLLYYASVKDSFISYGINLKDSLLEKNRTVFSKINTAVYQALNGDYLLGFNASEGKAMYCYAYKKDPDKKNNLLLEPATAATDSMILQMKAFLQTASNHYKGIGTANKSSLISE